jgi:uncharacterized protein (DUF58 family)/uncharacterized membrane protein SpoIIM required for sporulation
MSWRGRARAPFVEALCDLDEALEPQPSQKVECATTGPTAIEFSLVPRRRGTVRITRVWLRWPGPLGLVERVVRRPLDQDVAVVPNLRAVRRAAVRFFGAKEFLSGLKVEKTLGDGSEFASLREFLPGFDSRAIDWKSSARHSKLLCREYRAERNHQVVLAFDTGRLMREPLDGISRLDHAINASLLLGYICLKTGDRVGPGRFDERVRIYAEPKGGIASFAALQKAAARLDATPAETNFTLGLTELAARLKRRALVLLLTDFVDTITAGAHARKPRTPARRHLVLFASLRDPTPARIMATVPGSLDDISRAVVAHDIQLERELVFKRLRRLGVGRSRPPPGISPSSSFSAISTSSDGSASDGRDSVSRVSSSGVSASQLDRARKAARTRREGRSCLTLVHGAAAPSDAVSRRVVRTECGSRHLTRSQRQRLPRVSLRSRVLLRLRRKEDAGETLRQFLADGFPRAVRQLRRNVALSAIVLLLGVLTGFVRTAQDDERFYSYVDEDSAQGRNPASSTSELRHVLYSDDESAADMLTAFATFLFTHNARIGILAFALGFAAGVPTVFLLFQNGLLLGAFAALYQGRGLGADFWGWVLPHGITELGAVVLCGAAGLSLGQAILFPGRHGRLANLAIAGRRATLVVLGAIMMLFLAGLIEGVFRQSVHDGFIRYGVAMVTGLVWYLYFTRRPAEVTS